MVLVVEFKNPFFSPPSVSGTLNGRRTKHQEEREGTSQKGLELLCYNVPLPAVGVAGRVLISICMALFQTGSTEEEEGLVRTSTLAIVLTAAPRAAPPADADAANYKLNGVK